MISRCPRLCRGFVQGKQQNRRRRETKYKAKQNAEFEESAFAKVTAERVKRRFLFH